MRDEDLPLAGGEDGERVGAARRAHELRDDFGVQGGTSYGDPFQCLDEVADVGHPVLQEVADAGGVVGQQVGGVAGLDVLGEEQDAQALVAVAQLEGEAEALVGEGRRHPDVDDRDVGRVLGDRAAQRGRVARPRR